MITSEDRAVSVVVVDDHDLFRSGLVGLLRTRGVKVLGETRTAEDGLRMAAVRRPDVLVLDLGLPGMSGLEAIPRAIELEEPPAVLVLTGSVESDDVVEALLGGAAGFLVKDAPIEHITEAIEAALRGDVVIAPRLNRKLVERLRLERARDQATDQIQLSEREREVLALLVEGLDNAEIAERLFVSASTVKTHVSSVLRKVGVDNRLQAAVAAVRRGLV